MPCRRSSPALQPEKATRGELLCPQRSYHSTRQGAQGLDAELVAATPSLPSRTHLSGQISGHGGGFALVTGSSRVLQTVAGQTLDIVDWRLD